MPEQPPEIKFNGLLPDETPAAPAELARLAGVLSGVEVSPGEVAPSLTEGHDMTKLDEGYVSCDSLTQYLQRIRRIRLLSAEEEVDLAKRIEAGLYAKHLLDESESSGKPLPEGMLYEELKMVEHDGIQAKEHFIVANLRLVVFVARYYLDRCRSMEFLDLIQHGNIGLDKAVKKFDYTKAYKFSVYATWWIRHFIMRGIADDDRAIRIPVHRVDDINSINSYQNILDTELRRRATPEEIAEAMGEPLERVEQLMGYDNRPLSLEQSVGDEGDRRTLVDLIADDDGPFPESLAVRNDTVTWLNDFMGRTLNPRAIAVIRLRYGLDDGVPRSFAYIGEIVGLTGEGARQMEARTIVRLRNALSDGSSGGL